jgi:hypothetical protein
MSVTTAMPRRTASRALLRRPTQVHLEKEAGGHHRLRLHDRKEGTMMNAIITNATRKTGSRLT